MDKLAENIKKLRISKNLSQYDLGKMCDVSQRAICKFERGTGYPSGRTIIRLSKALGTTVEELVSEKIK